MYYYYDLCNAIYQKNVIVLLFISLECLIEDCMLKNDDYRKFIEYGKNIKLNENGHVPFTFNMGTLFEGTEAALELKGDHFYAMTPGDYVPPDYTHLQRVEDRTRKWFLSCAAPPTPEYLNMLIHSSVTFASFVNPVTDIEAEDMMSFHWLGVHWWVVDDIIDSINNSKVSYES